MALHMPTEEEGCVFCSILGRESEASVIYQDNRVTAFMDLHPVNPGHLLVIPNRHAADLAHLDPEDARHMFAVGQRLAAALRRSEIRAEGVNLFLSDGVAAGQSVFHCHLHVLPRYRGDRFRLPLGISRSPPRESLDSQAREIRKSLDRD
jgi:diadenosine tetraphosphate (Ap4A) HIT family hydrolase